MKKLSDALSHWHRDDPAGPSALPRQSRRARPAQRNARPPGNRCAGGKPGLLDLELGHAIPVGLALDEGVDDLRGLQQELREHLGGILEVL